MSVSIEVWAAAQFCIHWLLMPMYKKLGRPMLESGLSLLFLSGPRDPTLTLGEATPFWT